ncbi:sugar phosphate isomerase/epimerase [Bacillus sp. Marseille-Q3570]|uniref:sugar phosphate isomerase/epimerase family protein n=1 Tax=Bacillus sp. Marseille-Q3570 TaxID=2963522 RepID=UPI0021B74915|nr:sugar phosphate isomerase/epimerase [Bacillus sp. Marseille-Q3570]
MSKIGLQLYSIHEKTAKDFLGTVQKVAEIGYEGVQFAGFFETAARDVKMVLDENGLVSAGAHIALDQLKDEELKRTLEYQHVIGNKLIICPGIPAEKRQSVDDYKAIAETFNQIGEICKKDGFTFGYHNHDFEFDRFGERTGFDLLFENTDPSLVKMELDCYWAAFADHDPYNIIDKYRDRIVSLHIKDMKLINGDKIGTEVGNGQLNFGSIVKAAEEYGIEWLTVEQEEFERDPYESLTINLKNLQSIRSKVPEGGSS